MNAKGLGNVSFGGGDIKSIVGFSSAFKTINTNLDEEDALENTVSNEQVLDTFGKRKAKTPADDTIPRRGSKTAILLENGKNQKIVLAWVNKHLGERDLRVRNLSKSFKDGVILLNLLEILSGYNLKRFNKTPADRKEIVENMGLILKFLTVLRIDATFDPDDVMAGDSVAVVQVLLKLIDHFKEQIGKEHTVNTLKAVNPNSDSIMDLKADSGILRVYAVRTSEANRTRRGVKIDSLTVQISDKLEIPSETASDLPASKSPRKEKGGKSPREPKSPRRAKSPREPKSPRMPKAIEVTSDDISSQDAVPSVDAPQPASTEPAPAPTPTPSPKPASSFADALPMRRLQSAINRLTIEDKEVSFDDLDATLLAQDILDLEAFDVEFLLPEEPTTDDATEEDLLHDLVQMENLLDSLSNGLDVDIDIDM